MESITLLLAFEPPARAVKAPSILLKRPTNPIPTTFRYHTVRVEP
jgi:hypothetical protein